MLTRTDKLTDTDEEMDKSSNAGPLDTKYLYYPHLEGVTRKGSLLPASIVKTYDRHNKQ